QGLRLDASTSYALLVGVASTEDGTVLRVAPGDPDNSYLIQKLEGTASVGGQMPLGGTPLSQGTIDIIRQWITDGAIDDRLQSSDPVRVTSLTPVPGSDDAAPDEIVATFDRELDVSTVNANTFLLEGSGGDGSFGDGNEMPITAAAITTPGVSPMSATFDLDGVAMADDTYRVSLLGSGASVILDIDANALDGEFGGTFPSGDGAEGGDFEATFTVTTPPSGVTLADIQASVFTPNCTNAGCHSGGAPAAGMSLEAGQTFNNVVDVPSVGMPAMDRVEPGDPDNSFLVRRIEGTVAPQMPLGGAPLDQALIDDVRQWISDGANP
ncbi:MAG: Ig-like domain-containing protein, partial [Woeseiaceae bacterium]